ncbi:MAG TPA: DUF554 domain-containing protein [Chloroflexota bacterium]|nr:DUF554 domain-containing protein [Chloroflexota bacterium]
MTGTWINVATVLCGGLLGLALGSRFPDKVRQTVMAGLGLVTLVVGLQMALQTKNILVVLGSLLAGGIAGELLDIDGRITRLAQWVEDRFSRGESSSTFARAWVTTSLLFCVGPLTFTGAIQDGLTGDYHLLATKAMLDGFSSLAFGSALGLGVLASAATVLVYQGGLSLAAGAIKAVLTAAMINEMSATGGMLVLGLGVGLLELKAIRVANFLPALIIAPAAVAALAAAGIQI